MTATRALYALYARYMPLICPLMALYAYMPLNGLICPLYAYMLLNGIICPLYAPPLRQQQGPYKLFNGLMICFPFRRFQGAQGRARQGGKKLGKKTLPEPQVPQSLNNKAFMRPL